MYLTTDERKKIVEQFVDELGSLIEVFRTWAIAEQLSSRWHTCCDELIGRIHTHLNDHAFLIHEQERSKPIP